MDVDNQYNYYLDLFYQELDEMNRQKKMKKKMSLLNPSLDYADNRRKTRISNIIEICKNFNRDPEMFIDFIKKEINQENCYITEDNKLIISQYLTNDSFKKLMVNYCKRFITCKTCKNTDTYIIRDNTMKKNVLICNFCNHREYLSH